MSCSEAQLLANRANAARSTGPRSESGKVASRRNALTHGLTGGGIVIPAADAPEVNRRTAQLVAELATDGSATTLLLAERVAVLSVRLDRSVRHDFATTAERVRQTDDTFVADRATEAQRRFDLLADDPAARVALFAWPEGVDLVLGALRDLRRSPDPAAIDPAILARLLPGAEGIGSSAAIDAEIDRLEAHRATLDPTEVEQARARATDCALVGDDPATLLARKYEMATERSLFRTLKEIRECRKQASAPATVTESSDLDRSLARTQGQIHRQNAHPPTRLGSFWPEHQPELEDTPIASIATSNPPRHGQSRFADRKDRPRLKS